MVVCLRLKELVVCSRIIMSIKVFLFLIFIFSIYASRIIYLGNTAREQENRKVFARKLENEQDPVAEYLFQDIQNELGDDQALAGYFIGCYKRHHATYRAYN